MPDSWCFNRAFAFVWGRGERGAPDKSLDVHLAVGTHSLQDPELEFPEELADFTICRLTERLSDLPILRI